MKRRIIILAIVIVAIGGIAAAWWLLRGGSQNMTADQPRYLVSLGDSVAAGAGLPPSVSSGPYAACKLSDQAYPYLLAKQLNVELKQFACSGATIDGAINQAQFSGVPAQLPAAQPYLKGSDVVVNVGVNDVGGLELVARCARADDCLSASEQSGLQAGINSLSSNYSQLLSSLQAAGPRRIVVNTYYQILAPADTCFANFGITTAKINTINQLTDQINDVIEDVADEAGASVVKVDFSGHSLCAASPWIQGLLDSAPLHPTAAGQQQIASQDAAALR